jgi:acetyl esterase/lipase
MIVLQIALLMAVTQTMADEGIDVWPGLAPGETRQNVGETLPFRLNENPPVTRVVNITRPTFTVHHANNPNGTCAVILPGGGFGKVVTDKEGTEAADWLNRLGITAFVLRYRTSTETSTPWAKPLQDAQRTLALVRSQSDRWQIKKNRIGILGFSAGGMVAARLLCDGGKLSYEPLDECDDVPHRPDFAILAYPWNIYDMKRDALVDGTTAADRCPPTFLIHTDDDLSSSMGAALFYCQLKKRQIPAELHVYGQGGHGYGIREVPGSEVSSWTTHAAHWIDTLPGSH